MNLGVKNCIFFLFIIITNLKAETDCSYGIQLAFYPWSDNIGFLGELSSEQFIIYIRISGNIC